MKPKGIRILLVDYHEDVLIALEKLLEDAGFDTTTAWTAKEALTLADSSAFDLALVNEYLPDAECEEVLKALQKSGKQTFCIVMHASRRSSIAPDLRTWAYGTSSANAPTCGSLNLSGNISFAMGTRPWWPECTLRTAR